MFCKSGSRLVDHRKINWPKSQLSTNSGQHFLL